MRYPRNAYDEKRKIWQPKISEEMVIEEIVTRLWYHARIKLWRINCPVGGKVRPNVAGIPDLAGWLPHNGRAIWLEAKRQGGVHRTAQIQFITEAKDGHCIAGFVDSWDAVVKLFASYGIHLPAD